MPFWPIWLEDKGLRPTEIGFILAAAPFVRAFTSPIVAHVADRKGLRQPIILFLAIVALLSFTLFNWSSGFWLILAITVIFYTFLSSSQPLAESLTMHAVREKEVNYGKIRLWGSITFILGAVLAGNILEGRSSDVVLFMTTVGLIFIVLASFQLPKTQFTASKTSELPILTLIQNKPFVLMLLAAAMVQSSHAVVYSFSTIHWKSIGFSETLIGLLWAEGVIAEIILFHYSSKVFKYIKPIFLIIIGGAAGVLRWIILGSTDFLPFLIFAQALHGLTFGATHLGAIHFISDTIPERQSATAQSLFSALVMGIGIGSATMLSGWIFSRFASQAYFPMALLCIFGISFALTTYLVSKRQRE